MTKAVTFGRSTSGELFVAQDQTAHVIRGFDLGAGFAKVITRLLVSPSFFSAEVFSVNTKADCCDRPKLRIIEAMPNDSDAKVSVQKCDNCQTFWQVVVDQVITEKGDILVWDWFRQLEEEEALGILECMSPH